MKKFFTSIALLFVGIIISLFLVEFIVRIFLNKKPTTAWIDRPKFYFGAEGMPSMANTPFKTPKPQNIFRIGVVGDSYSFAPYMQFTDTFSKKLEQMLNLNNTPIKAEVINYGVPAYSTSHEKASVKRAIQDQANLIILQITLNDPELKPYFPTGITADMQDRFGQFKAQGKLAKITKHWKTAEFVITRIHNTKATNDYKDYFLDLFNNKRTWVPFTKELKRIVRMCKDSNTPLVAVVFPLFGMPMDDKYPFYSIHEKLNDFLTQIGVSHFDISETYRGIPLERLQVLPGKDRHPNEIAHRMAAEEIYEYLVKNGNIPNELQIKELFSERLGIKNQKRL